MREFQVYYMGLYVGKLVVNEKGQHSYCVNEPFQSKCFFRGHKLRKVLTTEQVEYGDPIEVFTNVIRTQDLFGRITEGFFKELYLKEVF